MILLVITILHGFTVAITAAQPFVYLPPESWAIDCGAKGNNITQSPRTRRWEGDIDSKMFPSHAQNSLSVASEVVDTFLVKTIPYKTARLSFSPFTFTFPVSLGPKFIRFHFYDSVYSNASGNLDPSATFFSVETGGLTLLKNFSVSLAAGPKIEQNRSVVEEFLVAVDKPVLNLTFIPSTSVTGAFAFVNGIEVVSVPDDLYYTQNDGLKYVGQHNLFKLENGTALATMYRVNIGGRAYDPGDDTSSMYRNWEQEDDYLTIPGVSVLPVTLRKLNITKPIQAYSAPEGVYQTARSIGNVDNKSLLVNYRLTWEFPVHPRFNYLVRLHFCEIGDDFINKTGDRVFHIYISDKLVEERADVIYWSGGKLVPYFRDYIVPMFGAANGQKAVNLSVALQPVSDAAISLYTDVLLNGIEIFKLNNSNGNLASPNPDPVPNVLPNSPNQQGNGKSNRTVIIGITAGVASGVVLLAVIGFFIVKRGRKVKNSTSDSTKSTKTRGSSTQPSDLCRYFSLADIKAATNNFEDIFVIGVGGFGNVYKGYIDNGTTPVAIKRLKSESSQGATEFKTEIEMLSQLRHRHLISLIGYCDDHGEMMLVYEYMPRGTLSSHLYSNADNQPLTWNQRLQISIGAASGLHYLHSGLKHTIIHRDIKSSNILLDENMQAKVSDFGLSKVGPTTASKTHVSTMVKGSFGYLDPEYYRRQLLTEKSDVYSFGVVLCEILCGRPPLLHSVEETQMCLVQWVRSCYQEDKFIQIVDPKLADSKIVPECLKKYCEIAVSCVADEGAKRPSMKEVFMELEHAIQLQNSEEERVRLGGEPTELNEDGSIRVHWSWEDPSGAIFSDIKGLQGR